VNPWDKDVDVAAVDHIVDQIRPIMHGYPRDIQGAVCANLLAMWIAGHRGSDAISPASVAFRNQLLTDAIGLIHHLIPIEDAWIKDQLTAKR
jgi:hypothetical protein